MVVHFLIFQRYLVLKYMLVQYVFIFFADEEESVFRKQNYIHLGTVFWREYFFKNMLFVHESG